MTVRPEGNGREAVPNINGLAEAALFVQNIPRARDFYEHVVGLETLQESEAGCVFAVAREEFLLLVSAEKAKVPGKTPGGDVPACKVGPGAILGAGHLAFAVAENEIHGWRTRLTSKGVEVLSEVAWKGGARSLYFRDPDGHLGYTPVLSFNPYWDRVGQTFQDPDGYRVVLQNAAWSR